MPQPDDMNIYNGPLKRAIIMDSTVRIVRKIGELGESRLLLRTFVQGDLKQFERPARKVSKADLHSALTLKCADALKLR